MAFSIYAKVELCQLSVLTALSYLEFLVDNKVSAHMIRNHVSAIRAMSIIYDLPYQPWEHPKMKYFVKSIKLTRPMALPTKRNIIDIQTPKTIIAYTQKFPDHLVYKAVFLTAFLGFFRLSNIAPHAISEFHYTRHFTGGMFSFEIKRFSSC